MTTLRTRVAELERNPAHSQATRYSSDAVLLAFLGFPAGYVPTDAELERIATGARTRNDNGGAKHDRTT